MLRYQPHWNCDTALLGLHLLIMQGIGGYLYHHSIHFSILGHTLDENLKKAQMVNDK